MYIEISQMGLVESKLVATSVKTVVRPDSITPLPSFTLDTAKFIDGSSGFLVTTVDLAKNTTMRSIPVSFMYKPAENTFVFIGKDESNVTFVKDYITGKIICSVNMHTGPTIVRHCVTTYEPLDDAVIDKIGELYVNSK